ncbi:hypothetical protein F5H01DRAFT_383851 [Linnemannia elongata]|nr:hypothetical protein F5H01DRAFT_383851 [Linnemannia elongata]
MSSPQPDTTSPPNSSTTPTTTTTKRPGEPSLGYKAATISGLVLAGMFLLAILVGLCTFRRALINRCSRRRYCAKPPPPLPRTLSRPRHQQQGLGGGGSGWGGGVRQMEESRRIMVPRDVILPLRQQCQTLSEFVTDEIGVAPRPGVESGGVESGEIQNTRSSQDSTQSSQMWASSTVDAVAPTSANIGVDGDRNNRRSFWQDLLQSFQTNRSPVPTDSISLAKTTTTTTTTTPPSASTSVAISRSTSLALLTSPTTTTTTTPTFSPTLPITPTPHQEAIMASAASVYTQAALSSPSLSSSLAITNLLLLPPIIYCPRERAELDQLRQKYPTAAPGYTTYRLPPEGVNSPPSFVALKTDGNGGSRTRRARAVSMHTGIMRVTFAEDTHTSDYNGGGAQRDRRASAAAIGHTNRNNSIATVMGTDSSTPAAATPVSTRRYHLPTSTSLPTFLTSPFLHFQNRPTLSSQTTLPSQTPKRKSRTTLTLRSLLPKDPTQDENHISNYFARNTRPYAPYSYPKIYAPSYSDCIDLPQIPPIPPTGEEPQPQIMQDNGAGVDVDIRFSFNNIDSNANSTGI